MNQNGWNGCVSFGVRPETRIGTVVFVAIVVDIMHTVVGVILIRNILQPLSLASTALPLLARPLVFLVLPIDSRVRGYEIGVSLGRLSR